MCMVCADFWERAYLTIMRPLLASSLLACPSERPHDLQGGTWSVHALRRQERQLKLHGCISFPVHAGF
jgi:hypothetical protein